MSVMRKKESLILGTLLKKLAPRLGAKIVVEPEWGVVVQITFPGRAGKSGRKSYFRYNTLDLNPVGASDVAKDKGFATYFMRRMGYPTVPGRAFFSDRWAKAIGSKDDMKAALRYAWHRGFPLIVKPNSGSQGKNVSVVHNAREMRAALKEIFLDDRVALVQKLVKGRDYRIVGLDNEIISAYERIPLNVIGDGKSTIAQLLKKDQQIFLLDNANLSSGGDAVDVTHTMHPSFKKIAIKLTKDMGLRLCGVDIMVDGTISEKPKKPALSPQLASNPRRRKHDAEASSGAGYWILEVNAAPGLDHYVKTGKAQQKTVEEMYLKVLKSLAKAS